MHATFHRNHAPDGRDMFISALVDRYFRVFSVKYPDFEPTADQKVRMHIGKKHKQFVYGPYKYAGMSRICPCDVSMSLGPEQKSKM